MVPALVVGLGLLLLAVWVVTNSRHVARREGQTADWQGDGERPDLWTSGAACVHCGASGGLLELVGDEVMFSCLACGRRSVRKTRS
jgi:hypothetical protein